MKKRNQRDDAVSHPNTEEQQ